MKYASPYQNMSLTLLREGSLISVKFKGGVFETEDPLIIAALEKHPAYGLQVLPVGVPAQLKGPKKKKNKESKAIEEFMNA